MSNLREKFSFLQEVHILKMGVLFFFSATLEMTNLAFFTQQEFLTQLRQCVCFLKTYQKKKAI